MMAGRGGGIRKRGKGVAPWAQEGYAPEEGGCLVSILQGGWKALLCNAQFVAFSNSSWSILLCFFFTNFPNSIFRHLFFSGSFGFVMISLFLVVKSVLLNKRPNIICSHLLLTV